MLCGALLTTLASCTSTQVTRISEKKILDLSGRWNDVDSRLVAEAMIQDISSSPWLQRFQQSRTQRALPDDGHQRYQAPKPVLIVGSIQNKSHEHIAPDTFIKDIERALINKGEIRVVLNSALKDKIRSERLDQTAQTGFVSPETQKRFGRELGADYMIFGTINAIVDAEGGNKVIFYQTSLTLVDVETSEVVWIGDKKIKKYVGGKRIKKKYQGKIPTS